MSDIHESGKKRFVARDGDQYASFGVFADGIALPFGWGRVVLKPRHIRKLISWLQARLGEIESRRGGDNV
jgi:hypothetical protein